MNATVSTDGIRRAAYTTPRPDIFDLVPRSAMRILDAGCSNGVLGATLRAAVTGRTVEGIEADVSLIPEAERNLDRVIRADLNSFSYELTYPAESFDCIIFADVLEHLIDPWTHLPKALHCLCRQGSIIVSLPNIRHVSALGSIFVKGTFPRRERGIFDSTHLHWFTIRDGLRLMQHAGLRVTDVDYSLRVRDRGGGLVNKVAIKLCDPVRRLYPIREFLTYQYCMRAIKP